MQVLRGPDRGWLTRWPFADQRQRMSRARVDQVRRFNRTVTERAGALNDNFPGRERSRSLAVSAMMRDVERPPAGQFLVAYLYGDAIGCGAVKHNAGAPTEIKRMWIAPPARGLGLGRRLLAQREACAIAGGAHTARLETSAVLAEALALYRSAGWIEVPAFNDEPFADHWFEKALGEAIRLRSPPRRCEDASPVAWPA